MSKWLPPALLWALCAVLWLGIAVDRSCAVDIPEVTVVKETSGARSVRNIDTLKTDGVCSENAASTGQCINVNKAAADELDALPGVGPVIAQRIIDYRNRFGSFTSVSDLQKVKGIGKVTVKKIGSQACF